MNGADLSFVNLGITINHLKNSINIFGFRIAFYGIIIGIAMLAGIGVAQSDARRKGQNPEIYLDFALYAIIFSIIGARFYYVLFEWKEYKDDLLQVFNLRAGGLAIYGGVIAAVITLIIFTRIRKISFFTMADTCCLGLITGQIIGRWGNFFNCEAFGEYTNNLFAMRIKESIVNPRMLSENVLNHIITEDSTRYIQVHPTFLYESVWNLCALIFLLWYRKRQKFDGEILWLYLLEYGIGRFLIEGLRTDQLIFFNTGVPVSQALALIMAIVSIIVLVYNYRSRSSIRRD